MHKLCISQYCYTCGCSFCIRMNLSCSLQDAHPCCLCHSWHRPCQCNLTAPNRSFYIITAELFSVISFCLSLNVSSEFSCCYVYCVLCSTLRWHFFKSNFQWHPSMMHTSQKCCKWTRCVQQKTSVTHNDVFLWDTKCIWMSRTLQCMYTERMMQYSTDWPCITELGFPYAWARD